MLLTAAVLLTVLWFLGMIGFYSVGWALHFLLALAVILTAVRLTQHEDPFRSSTPS